MSLAQEEKAKNFYAQAEKKLKGFSMFNNSGKQEDACELFVRAGNTFKVAKRYDLSAQAYEQAARCQLKLGSAHEAANHYISAANASRKNSTDDAIKYLAAAVEMFVDEGRFTIAARHVQEMAELYEGENELEKAIEKYNIAADYFEDENSASRAKNCLLKVALFEAQLEHYETAIEIYEKLAIGSVDNKLLKWSVREYFFRAILCFLASNDQIGGKNALERYNDIDATFSTTREHKFCADIIDAFEEFDAEAFTNVLVEYDSVTKLDAWRTTMLLRIKNLIHNEDGGLV